MAIFIFKITVYSLSSKYDKVLVTLYTRSRPMAAMKAMKPTLIIGSGLNWRDVDTPSSDLVNISKFENSAMCKVFRLSIYNM